MLIYCDSVILIYYYDSSGSFNARATSRLAAMAAAQDRIAISDLVRLEYRVKPLKHSDTVKLAEFDKFCSQPNVHFISVTAPVFERATLIRATYNFKLGDSIHLAAAVEGGCDRFLTNDGRLSAFKGIHVEVLP